VGQSPSGAAELAGVVGFVAVPLPNDGLGFHSDNQGIATGAPCPHLAEPPPSVAEKYVGEVAENRNNRRDVPPTLVEHSEEDADPKQDRKRKDHEPQRSERLDEQVWLRVHALHPYEM
jgi:hypothetical protein